MASGDLTQNIRIDISMQNRQLNAVSTASFLSGVSFSLTALAGSSAYLGTGNTNLLTGFALMFGLAGLLFATYAGAVIGRLYSYIYNGEIIIESQHMAITDSRSAVRRVRGRPGEGDGDSGASAPSPTLNVVSGPWREQ